MDKKQLANKIWASANKLRSKIDANEYKDYILGFIFYKFLSDREEQRAHKEGWTSEAMESEFHEANADVVNHFQVHLGYFISHKHLLSTWLSKGTAFSVADVRDALQSFTRLIAPSHKKVFANVFDTLETGLGKLGDTESARTKAIKQLLEIIRDVPTDNRQDYDVLGFVYEYLIGMFAANAGKKAGEFYTPHEVALVIAEIVAEHLKENDKISIYDPTSGSGSLLINIGRAVARHQNGPDGVKYYAQELKENTYNLTRMNLVMRGIAPEDIEVRNGDTLERDWPYFDEAHPDDSYDPLFVDAVVSNPPYSQHWSPAGHENDVRFANFGIAPKSKADYAFLLHDLHHLRREGIMAIVLPHGVLFRGKPDDGSEGSIRKALVEGNHVDAVIGLPPNIFFGTGIPTIVMILRKRREHEDTLIVDASRGFAKDGKKNRLRACDVKRIVDTVVNRAETPGYSRRVGRDAIRANDYNLNIPRYVRTDETERWDVRAVMEGGIPNRELDELAPYWDTLPGLRDALFAVVGNRSRPLEGVDWERVPSVSAYRAHVAYALKDFGGWLKRELVDGRDRVKVNAEEGVLAEELFRRVDGLPLVDRYGAYQHLHESWTGTATDLEILQTEGFDAVRKVDPNMTLKKSGDEEIEVQDGWRGRIVPLDLVARVKFAAEIERIAAAERAAERAASEIAGLAAEVPEDEQEGVFKEDGEAFDPKGVEAKLAEILADVSTPEIAALKGYLALSTASEKKDYAAAHAEVDWSAMSAAKNGTYAKGAVAKRILSLQAAFPFTEDSFEALVVKVAKLMAEEKRLVAEAKSLRKDLDGKCIEAVRNLTDAEALDLLERKWVRPLVEKLAALPDEIFAALAAKLKALEKKYAVTYKEVAGRIGAAQSELSALMGELTGDADDLAGLAAWKKELGA